MKSIKNAFASLLALASFGVCSAFADDAAISVSTPVPGSNPNSEPCVADTKYGAKDNFNQFSIDLSNSRGKNFDLVMFGDSVTENWGSTGVEGSVSKLKIDPSSDGVFSMGIGGNRTQNMIYRCEHGAFDNDYTTKYFTLLAGVNNIYQRIIDSGEDPDDPRDVAEAIRIILNSMLTHHPESKVLLMPILPYAFRYEKNGQYLAQHVKGIRVRENTEAINDIIIKFVDNRRIFWLDVRGKFLTEEGLPNFDLFGGPSGTYDPDQCLHPRTEGYVFFNEAVVDAMRRYNAIAAGTAQETDPSLGIVTASQEGFASSETISLSGIFLGTDANAVSATSYSIAYELDGGAKTTALSNQTATRNSFEIDNLTPGEHTVKVIVTTSAGKEVSRTITVKRCDGWLAEALPATSNRIITDGTLVCSYARGNYTINTVPFSLAMAPINSDYMSFNPGIDGGGGSVEGAESGAYSSMLKSCWWFTAGKRVMTLKNLTPGHNYLVQVISCRNENTTAGNLWVDEAFHESYSNPYFTKAKGAGWPYGGSLTGVFTADATATKTISFVCDGNQAINAIQVRDLGDSGYVPVAKVNPSIASVTVATNGDAATVTLTDVVMGTDDDGTAAASYAVSYSLNGAASVVVLSDQTGASATFTITDLADATYACDVTITTDAGKAATKSVRFTVDAVPDPVDPSLAATASVSGSDVTVGVSSVVMGTDAACNPASSYTLSYVLAGADEVIVQTGLSATSASFTITGLSEGSYSCVVKLTTDKGTTATKTVSFKIESASTGGESGGESGGADVPVSGGWVVFVPTESEGFLCTTGALVYAYAPAPLNLGGVSFSGDQALAGGDFSFSATGFSYDSNSGSGGLSGEWASLMRQSWRLNSAIYSMDVTLNGLTAGKEYLVQLISHSKWSERVTLTAGGQPAQNIDSDHGVSVVGIFTATGSSQTFTLEFGGSAGPRVINAIQVRDLGEGGEVPEPPHAHVWSDWVTNVVATATTAGERTRTCTASGCTEPPATETEVIPATGSDAGGEDNPPAPLEAGWTATPMSDNGDTIKTDGTLCYAYARRAVTVNGVAFEALGNVNLQDVRNAKKFSFSGDMNRDMNDDAADDYANLLTHRFVGATLVQTLTLKDLTPGNRYLVQLVLCFPESYASGTRMTAPDGVTVAKANGTGWENGGSLVGVFTATNDVVTFEMTSKTYTCMNAIQVRDLGAGGSDPEPAEAPVIGGTGVAVPMAVSATGVTLTIGNAAKGHTYGYKKSTTLAGLATATVVYLASPADADGVLSIEIPKDAQEPSCFYQIVVD